MVAMIISSPSYLLIAIKILNILYDFSARVNLILYYSLQAGHGNLFISAAYKSSRPAIA
jgi:hypothetical protein